MTKTTGSMIIRMRMDRIEVRRGSLGERTSVWRMKMRRKFTDGI